MGNTTRGNPKFPHSSLTLCLLCCPGTGKQGEPRWSCSSRARPDQGWHRTALSGEIRVQNRAALAPVAIVQFIDDNPGALGEAIAFHTRKHLRNILDKPGFLFRGKNSLILLTSRSGMTYLLFSVKESSKLV